MACPLRPPGSPPGVDWDKMEDYFVAGGMTPEEAKKAVVENATADTVKEGMESQRLNDVVTYSTDYNTRKAAATEIAKEPLSKTLNDPTRVNNADVQNAWKEKGVSIGGLTGKFDATKVNEKEYLATRITAGDTTAKGYTKRIATTGKTEEKIALINKLAQSTSLKYEDAMRAAVGEPALKEYKTYYTKYENIDPNNITIDQVYGKMEWTDGMGNKYNFDVANGAGMLYDPSTGDYNKELLTEQKVSKGYKSATFTFNRGKYAELLLSGQKPTKDELQAIFNDGSNTDWWSCVGTLCPSESGLDESGGGGGGGGGGGSGGGSSSYNKPSTTSSLYVESNTEADVYDTATGKKIGVTNTMITMEPGTYTIETRKKGYKRVNRATTIGNYPINITMNMYKALTGPATFIENIGGLSKLTPNHALYAFSIYKARNTGALDWRTLASELQPGLTAPEQLTLSDVQYIWYLANGEPGRASQLLADGKVSLADGEE